LPMYLDAGAYETALQRFAAGRKLTPPKKLAAIRNEAQMAYVISRRRLGFEYTDTEVEAASAKFLTRNVNTWLLGGHSDRVAQWMKIVYWQEGKVGLSPKEALLKCYDHLPGCERPPRD